MILGLSQAAFTSLHTGISVVAIAVGLLLMTQMMRGRHDRGWALAFLVMTILTSVTGFMFPATAVTPAHVVGGISLAVLAMAITALYAAGLRGGWRTAYVVSAAAALYLNMFVAVVQAFQKLPHLARLAPTQTEPPFIAAQVLLLLAMLIATGLARRRFGAAEG